MFLGHFGAAFALKPAVPRVSLGMLFLSAQFVDLLWPGMLLIGAERVEIVPGITRMVPLDFVHYPITHSLIGAAGWALLVGLVYGSVRRSPAGAWGCGIAVLSHWVLDAIVHRPDLPLAPGESIRVGFGLWNHPVAAIALESAVFAAGLWLYLRVTRPVDRTGTRALVALVIFLVVVHAGNIVGPPPPSAAAIAGVGHAQWVFVLLAFWVDRHRRVVEPAS